MIFENIKNMKNYTSVNSRFKAAFDYLINTDLNALPVGKYEIDGKNVYALVQEYMTENAEKRRFEAHKKYIDIQYIISGREIIGYFPLDTLEMQEDKLQEKDVAYYRNVSDYTKLTLHCEDYAIFFPEEAHKPCCEITNSSQVKKIVVKVLIN